MTCAARVIQAATLTSVVHGPAGWVAVGTPGPVVLTSVNGTTWRPAMRFHRR